MMRCSAMAASVLLLVLTSVSAAQAPVDAQWIWFDAGKPAESAPRGKVWFRRELRASEPSTGAIRIACDDRFVLWVNDRRIGAGGGDESVRFNLNGIVDRGLNVIAVEAMNRDGRAGLFVDGEIRGQSGRAVSFDSGPDWRATRVAPEGTDWLRPRFDATAWKPVKVLGKHEQSPWKAIAFGDSYLDRFDLAPGFELQRIGEPELVGSLVAITWGNRGRLIASREQGPILSVIDEDADGIYDKVVEYCTEVTNCQGLCTVGDVLYAVGVGPEKRTGIYRLPDRDHNDVADEVELVYAQKGSMGEHGPHDVVFGPDGWLYHNLGNHAWITADPEPTSPVRRPYEGDLLRPRFEDARGHASGIKVPGGTIWRFTPDGKRWWLQTNGFRNEYDVAFNRQGDLFTFDSDMEWDVAQPWYRPIRINHCIPGAEFGWRSGAAKWPQYYFDSLPTTVDVGRGSPTGVICYEHDQFPEKYRGAVLACDWSVGRIVAVRLEQDGASYKATWDNLVTGNPLNVSDIEVDRDGTVVFATGGRRTEGGLYRVRHTGSAAPKPGATSSKGASSERASNEALSAAAVLLPQPSSAWAREAASEIKRRLGAAWAPAMQAKAQEGVPSEAIQALTWLSQLGPKPSEDLLLKVATNKDSKVRAFAALLLGDHPSAPTATVLTRLLSDPDAKVRRRACEAFVRSGLEAKVEPLLEMMAGPDRWLRFAARLALERVPTEKWRDAVLTADNPQVRVLGLLALHRLGNDSLPSGKALDAELALLKGHWSDSELTIKTLRMVELTLLDGATGPTAEAIGHLLLAKFPTGEKPIDREASRLLAVLQTPGAAEKIVAAMEAESDQAQRIHYAVTLRYLDAGWDVALKRRLLDWYEGTREWEGGASFAPYLANIVGGSLARCTPTDRVALLREWKERPFATRLLLERSKPDEIADHARLIEELLADFERLPAGAEREALIGLALGALGKDGSEPAQALLRKLYDEQPDRRGSLAIALAKQPSPENWPYLVRTLQFADPNTMQACLAGLRKIDRKPEKPGPIRTVIQAGLQLGDRGGLAAADLLSNWTGVARPEGKDAAKAVAFHQDWYRKEYPNEPAPELPAANAAESKYTYDQLLDYLTRDSTGRNGDPARGKLVFAKANCAKCHRFLKEGEGIGPDLTTVRKRFQKKEIIESLVYPSKVISDQYRGVTVATTDGLVYTGLTASQEGDDKLVLLLSNSTKVEIPRSDVEEIVPAKTSVMPIGILKDLTLPEIADLFAFLETSKFNADPAPAAASGGSGGR